ncbi:tubulin tyrosine ligase-like 6B isoform X2 [Haematobia irritans]|uniref:tubulin tyrosine ligase-like 6B isoform X2 n=1 Tax=Haematobia irritans TaxID=7368 RepID=UPI003F501373
MNLRKSKFFKRIQTLRRMSKEQLHRERERSLNFDSINEDIFYERNGMPKPQEDQESYCGKRSNDGKFQLNNKSKGHQKNDEEHITDNKTTADGLIHINNTCFRVKIPTPDNSKEMEKCSESMPSISICISNSRYSMIGAMAKSLGFKVVKENKLWNILWTDSLPGVELYKNMKRFQQINHFPGMMEICRKDLLSRNLNRMLKLYPKDYKIFPKTWIFPADYGEAVNYCNNSSKQKTFIIKPDAGAQGRGIWLTNDLRGINPTDRMICQTYIGKPLLIDGYKFDLRLYVLITSVDPLRIFMYNEGLVRFATSKYVEPSANNSSDLFMHLTNYSVNKRNSQYDLCDNDDCGSKRKLNSINKWLRQRHHNVEEFWSKIDDIIIKTVLSAWPVLKHNYHACFPSHDKIQACFEILGFDILVDSKFRPYVLEVNHSPSFHTHELVDRQVKRPLIRDTLMLVSTALADKKQILKEDRKRVKHRLLKLKQANRSSIANEPRLEVENNSPRFSALAQQIAWEESHLGNFRRIMPPSDARKLNYYSQFYGQENQASIFAETAASKKREEASKKLRLQLEEKRRKLNDILNRKVPLKFEERRRKRSALPRVIAERNRQMALRNQVHWKPGFISAAEERLRLTYMQMRMDVLKDMRILEMIYSNLYKAGNLSNTDIIKFPELYRCLESGCDITVSS